MTLTDKRSLISVSVTAIRITVHPVGEETEHHVVHVTPRVSRLTTVHKVPTKSKSGFCSWDEALAPSDHPTQPST
jgi:hypothetical protein